MTELSGRFAIVPARGLDDRRLGNAAFKVLAALGHRLPPEVGVIVLFGRQP